MGLREQLSDPLYTDPRFIHNERSVLMQDGDLEFAKKYRTFEALEPGKVFARNGNIEYVAEEGQVIIFPASSTPTVGEEIFSIGREFTYSHAV